MQAPFGPRSRTGVELELVGPAGARRAALAAALAARFGGAVVFSFKALEGNVDDADGAHVGTIFDLVPAYRVVDAAGAWLVTLEDDFSVRAGLNDALPTRTGMFRVLAKEPSVASYIERRCLSSTSHQAALDQFLRDFDVVVGDAFEDTAVVGERLIYDPVGAPVAAVGAYHEDRERVAELVTRPLHRDERQAFLAACLDVVVDEGFGAGDDCALQFHVDRDPWMDTARIIALVTRWQRERHSLLEQWEPRQPGTVRGPFDDELVALCAATPPSTPFADFAAAARALDVPKGRDWNLRGVLWSRPRRPTLEARFWNARTDVELVIDALQRTERWLSDVAAA